VIVAHHGKHLRPWLTAWMDMRSRKIVGWEVHDSDDSAHAAHLVRRTALSEGIAALEQEAEGGRGPWVGDTVPIIDHQCDLIILVVNLVDQRCQDIAARIVAGKADGADSARMALFRAEASGSYHPVDPKP